MVKKWAKHNIYLRSNVEFYESHFESIGENDIGQMFHDLNLCSWSITSPILEGISLNKS